MWDGRRNAQNSEEAKRPYRSLIDCRSASTHALLRQPWSRSFTAEPLQDYERLLLRRIVQLNSHLARQIGNASDGRTANVDMAKWMASLAFVNFLPSNVLTSVPTHGLFPFISFDFMGDLAYVDV